MPTVTALRSSLKGSVGAKGQSGGVRRRPEPNPIPLDRRHAPSSDPASAFQPLAVRVPWGGNQRLRDSVVCKGSDQGDLAERGGLLGRRRRRGRRDRFGRTRVRFWRGRNERPAGRREYRSLDRLFPLPAFKVGQRPQGRAQVKTSCGKYRQRRLDRQPRDRDAGIECRRRNCGEHRR
jgi:hypothetical protein